MGTHLDRILMATRNRLESARGSQDQDLLEEKAASMPPARDFREALDAPGISLIAEIKRRSPSAGPINPSVDPAEIASAYELGGARALSVLTEPDFFDGSLEDLRAAREAVKLPVLRKDFVVDRYQVVEARAAGADAVLLIAAALAPSLLVELCASAEGWGMAALVEIHDEDEVSKALGAGARIVGINQRDLRTFEVDPTLALRLRDGIPGDVVVVAESGISSGEEVRALEEAGIDAILVGEALMRSGDPARAAAELLGGS